MYLYDNINVSNQIFEFIIILYLRKCEYFNIMKYRNINFNLITSKFKMCKNNYLF